MFFLLINLPLFQAHRKVTAGLDFFGVRADLSLLTAYQLSIIIQHPYSIDKFRHKISMIVVTSPLDNPPPTV